MDNNVKAEESEPQFKCMHCAKIYTKESDLEVHIKLKHKPSESKQPSRKSRAQPRNRVLQVQQNQHEDTIYAYLGELGEKNQQNAFRQQLMMSEEIQKESIQSNYSFNKVIRTPYEKQIDPLKHIPKEWISEHPEKEFLTNLQKQLKTLYEKLSLEKQKWEFRDPMGPEEEAEDEFSLMEIRKLIINYPKRNIVLKYPHLSIFLLWVGRICKPPAWSEFFMLFSTFMIEFDKQGLEEMGSEKWEKFSKIFESRPVSPSLLQKLSICDDRTVKKLIQYYCKWVQLYELTDFCD